MHEETKFLTKYCGKRVRIITINGCQFDAYLRGYDDKAVFYTEPHDPNGNVAMQYKHAISSILPKD